MKKMHEIIDHHVEKKYSLYLFLFLFHASVAVLLYLIANSDFLAHLHNGEGFWNFSRDSTLYHAESVQMVEYLRNGEWRAWFSSFPYHHNVKIVSIIYWLTGTTSPISYEIVNGTVWALSVVITFRLSYLISKDRLVSILTVLFFFQPSVLIMSTQILRDSIFILGFVMVCYGWITLMLSSARWTATVNIIIGIMLIFIMRSYLLPPFIIFFAASFVYVFFYFRDIVFQVTLLMIVTMILQYSSTHIYINPVFQDEFVENMKIHDKKAGNLIDEEQISENRAEQISENRAEQISENRVKLGSVNGSKPSASEPADTLEQEELGFDDGVKSNPTVLDLLSNRLMMLRDGFTNVNLRAGSIIDSTVRYDDFYSALFYLPRAAQVAFLSPFPDQWLRSGKETGRVGVLVAAIEMAVWYALLVGIVLAIYFGRGTINILLPILILSASIVILLGYTIPNVGTIYRIRQGFMIPFYLVGFYGFRQFWLSLSRMNSKND